MAESDDTHNGSDARVGFRDIYRAVGESEARIKEHISLVLLPITAAVADHERRIRSIEETGTEEAREALARASSLATEHAALDARVEVLEDTAERRMGAIAVLGAQRSFIILIGVLVSIAIGIADLVAFVVRPTT